MRLHIGNIKPSDCPEELRARIEKVMASKKISWGDAVIFLITEVLPPQDDE